MSFGIIIIPVAVGVKEAMRFALLKNSTKLIISVVADPTYIRNTRINHQ